MARCKFCGQEIDWITSLECKPAPVDPDPVFVIEGDGINLAFPSSKTRQGRVVKGRSNTLACDCEGCVYHDGVIRKYTLTELERLQTLPDGYTERGGATRVERVKAIGNGWTAAVIAEIFSKIR